MTVTAPPGTDSSAGSKISRTLTSVGRRRRGHGQTCTQDDRGVQVVPATVRDPFTVER